MRLTLALLALGLFLSACGRESSPTAPNGKLRVVATTTMIGDLVRQTAGDRIHLTVLMPPGTDPHTYKPSTADLGAVAQADLIFYNGLHLEGKMIELFEHQLVDKAFPVAGAIPETRLLGWQEGQGGAHDPHIWFDCQLWSLAAGEVGRRLAEKDPPHADHYHRHNLDFQTRLTELDHWVRQKVASLPENRRVLITSHDAYGYFGKAYGIQVMGIQGISTESEAGLAAINAAVDFILRKQVPALFIESSVSPRTLERVRADARSRGLQVKIGGELYSDAMGAAGERSGFAVETYEGMMRYNVTTLVEALATQP